jgi:hypothetical protein
MSKFYLEESLPESLLAKWLFCLTSVRERKSQLLSGMKEYKYSWGVFYIIVILRHLLMNNTLFHLLLK